MNPCWRGETILFRIGVILIAIILARSLDIVVIIVIDLQCFNCEHETCLGMGLISPFFMLSPSIPSVKADLSRATQELASSSQNFVVMQALKKSGCCILILRPCNHI